MSFVKYVMGALVAIVTALLTLSSSGFFEKPESYYLFLAYRFRYDVAVILIVLLAVFFSKEIFAAVSNYLSRRSRGISISYVALATFCTFCSLWIVREDLTRYMKERVLYFEHEFSSDYSRFLTLVGDQHHFNGQYTLAVKLWNLAGGDRNAEKVRITDERRTLAAKIFASSQIVERKLGPNVDTYFAAMQAIYIYPESEEYLDKINWYLDELRRAKDLPCEDLQPKQYWIYYGQYFDLKPGCDGVNYRAKWYFDKVENDLQLLKEMRADADGIFELLARSEADTLSNKGFAITDKSLLSRIYRRLANFRVDQDLIVKDDDEPTEADESDAEESDESAQEIAEPTETASMKEAAVKATIEDTSDEVADQNETEDLGADELGADTQQSDLPNDKAEDAENADKSDDAADKTSSSKFRWPVRGAVIVGYGKNINGIHNPGIDISVPEGTPIRAAADGNVIYSGSGLKDLGNTVLVRHDTGTVTVYGNASELKVKRGERVTRGQILALSGMSGGAKRPMVHFEVRQNSAAVNPMTFLQ